MLRILHIGLGPLGHRIVRDLHTRKVGKVVGAVDISPELIGKPLSKVIDGEASKVVVRASIAQAMKDAGGKVDAAIVTTASDMRACAETFSELLKLGIAVVSTCEEATWPWLRHPALSKKLDALARKHGGRLLGTGVNPGYLMDTVPVFATAACREVESIEIHRFQDATTRRIPFQKKIGATLDDKAFKQGIKDGWLRHVGLGESLHFVADCLGWKVSSWSETIKPVKASKAMKCGLGAIKAGNAAGVRQEAVGICDGKRVLKFVFQAAIGEPRSEDRVIVRGEPNVNMVFEGGVHGDIATSSVTINSIPALLKVGPGLHTMNTIPLVHFVRGK